VLDQALAASAVLGGEALLLGLRTFRDCSTAKAAVFQALRATARQNGAKLSG
jgi:hypothetical protein